MSGWWLVFSGAVSLGAALFVAQMMGIEAGANYAARARCWARGWHRRGVGRFRFDCDGTCDDCGVVGSGVSGEDGE